MLTSRLLWPLRATALAAGLLAATLPAASALAAPAQHAASPAKRQLDQLADQFHRARAQFDPLLFATANGDSRYDDQIGMAIAPAVRAKQFALYRSMQGQLSRIPTTGLADADQLSHALLAYELDAALALAPFPEHLLPLNHFDNVPATLANYAGGAGSQPLGTVKQYQAYLKRVVQLSAWLDQAMLNMREGIKQGVVQPRSIVQAMLPQFRALRSASVEQSVYYSPVLRMPASFSPSDKARLTKAYHGAVQQLAPRLDKLLAFLENDYLAASRASAGWSALPNGAAWYQARVQDSTNLPLAPQTIHELGLKEVARIEQSLAGVASQLGYSGPMAAFQNMTPEQKQAMIQQFQSRMQQGGGNGPGFMQGLFGMGQNG